MSRVVIGSCAELPSGSRRLITVDGVSVGVFNVGGRYVAVRNSCPHAQAPVCLGRLDGSTLPGKPGEFVWGREGEVLACPWHGWEYDLLTGACLADPRIRLRTYPVSVEDGHVVVDVH